MPKEPRDISQTVGFVTKNDGELVSRRSFEAVGPDAVELAEALADETEERGV